MFPGGTVFSVPSHFVNVAYRLSGICRYLMLSDLFIIQRSARMEDKRSPVNIRSADVEIEAYKNPIVYTEAWLLVRVCPQTLFMFEGFVKQ